MTLHLQRAAWLGHVVGKKALPIRAHVRGLKQLVADRAYINGSWVSAADGAVFDVTNPATNEVVGRVPDMQSADLETAVQAAYEAQQSWQETLPRYRSELLQNYYRLLEQHKEELAVLMTREQGKPLAEARAEVAYSNSFIDWFSGEARRIYGEVSSSAVADRETIFIRQPAGVAALITPWNFPQAMITRKLGAALACGCTSVIKPAEDTPLSALALAALAEEAGLPKGVVNVVTTSRDHTPAIGRQLARDKRIAVLSFTGSTAVGKLLYEQCASTVKKLSLELGGNSPFIVFNSADVQKAVAGCMASKFRNAGQTCVSTNRILVQSGVYEEFVTSLREAMTSQLLSGNGLSDGVNVGPLINDAQHKKVRDIVNRSVKEGAHVVLGGGPHELGGRFFAPTLLTEVTPEVTCFQQEVFGPVAACLRFETEEQAVQIANNTDMGLAAYVFTENMAQAWRVSRRLQYGMVGINEGLLSQAEGAFGGWKESGLGREGGRYSIEDYTELKYLCISTKQ